MNNSVIKNIFNIQYRFKSYTYSWEQHKLEDLGSVRMNKRIHKKETSEHGDVPFYKIGTFGKKADSFISNDLFEKYKEKFSYPNIGDILISASGSIGKFVEYDGERAYFQDSNIVWIDTNDKITNKFLKQYYKIIDWNGIEGTTIKRLYNKNILNTVINIPQVSEQRKIGKFLSFYDNLIKLYEEKIKNMKLLKKFLMQNMFI